MTAITVLCYIGPGGALSAIGAFLALLAAVVFAAIGFVWYPIKRLLRVLRARAAAKGGAAPETTRRSETAGSGEP